MGVARAGWRVASLNEVTPETPEDTCGCSRVHRRPTGVCGLRACRRGPFLESRLWSLLPRAPLGPVTDSRPSKRGDLGGGPTKCLALFFLAPVDETSECPFPCDGLLYSRGAGGGGWGRKHRNIDSGESADGTFASCKYLAEKRQYCKV